MSQNHRLSILYGHLNPTGNLEFVNCKSKSIPIKKWKKVAQAVFELSKNERNRDRKKQHEKSYHVSENERNKDRKKQHDGSDILSLKWLWRLLDPINDSDLDGNDFEDLPKLSQVTISAIESYFEVLKKSALLGYITIDQIQVQYERLVKPSLIAYTIIAQDKLQSLNEQHNIEEHYDRIRVFLQTISPSLYSKLIEQAEEWNDQFRIIPRNKLKMTLQFITFMYFNSLIVNQLSRTNPTIRNFLSTYLQTTKKKRIQVENVLKEQLKK